MAFFATRLVHCSPIFILQIINSSMIIEFMVSASIFYSALNKS